MGIVARFSFPPRLTSVNLCMMSKRSLSFCCPSILLLEVSLPRHMYLIVGVRIACSFVRRIVKVHLDG